MRLRGLSSCAILGQFFRSDNIRTDGYQFLLQCRRGIVVYARRWLK